MWNGWRLWSLCHWVHRLSLRERVPRQYLGIPDRTAEVRPYGTRGAGCQQRGVGESTQSVPVGRGPACGTMVLAIPLDSGGTLTDDLPRAFEVADRIIG
jgi:hypothetical protein